MIQRICDLHLIKRQQISSGITPYSQDFGTKMECLISSLKKESDLQSCATNPELATMIKRQLIISTFLTLGKLVKYLLSIGCFQQNVRIYVNIYTKDITCQEKTNNNDAVSESVRQNIKLIESDLMVCESNLVDELQINAYLFEEETKTMKLSNRSDQAHHFAEILEVMNERNFLRIVIC